MISRYWYVKRKSRCISCFVQKDVPNNLINSIVPYSRHTNPLFASSFLGSLACSVIRSVGQILLMVVDLTQPCHSVAPRWYAKWPRELTQAMRAFLKVRTVSKAAVLTVSIARNTICCVLYECHGAYAFCAGTVTRSLAIVTAGNILSCQRCGMRTKLSCRSARTSAPALVSLSSRSASVSNYTVPS